MADFYKPRYQKHVRKLWTEEPAARKFNYSELEQYGEKMRDKDAFVLDEQTKKDLNMKSSFQKMNRTFSNPGEQILYNLSETLIFDKDELQRRADMIEWFRKDAVSREKLQCLMHYMRKKDKDYAARCLYDGMPEPPKSKILIIPATIAMIAAIISMFFIPYYSIRIFVIFAVLMVNLTLHFLWLNETKNAMPGIYAVARMIAVAEELCMSDYPMLAGYYSSCFYRSKELCGKVLRRVRFNGAGLDPWGISYLISVLLLSDERAYISCYKCIQENTEALRDLYIKLGELDAFQAAAAFKRNLVPVCKPEFVEKNNYIRAVSIGHPAIKAAVCNDITLEHKNLVLTGSNMSGKSTFLRTLAYNAVLAQTFCMVKAESYQSGMFQIATSISPSDDMEQGKSYYMSEAQALLRMLPLCESETSALLVIDEIFRGTNPTERVAGASSLLTYLSSRNCTVIVATHDIEITKNVEKQYESYHFEEKVSRDSLEFDYILRPGILKKPNGIHILEYLGFPDEITQAAMKAVSTELSD